MKDDASIIDFAYFNFFACTRRFEGAAKQHTSAHKDMARKVTNVIEENYLRNITESASIAE